MANQVFTILPSGNYGLDGFPLALSASLPIAGVLPNVNAQSDMVPASQNFLGHSFGGSHSQVSPQASLSQCPLSQAQCEQFLNFLKNYMALGSSNSAQTGHQVTSIMATKSSIPQTSPSTYTSPSFSSKFSGNSYWIPPNFSHSIFSAQVVDRHAYKTDTWILDTGATNHMVHSVTQFIEITSIVQTCVFLPNGEQALVTHVDTMQVSSTLTLTGVLCVPSFCFNLISASKLTKKEPRIFLAILSFLVIVVLLRTLLNGA